jgi:hypothetical protein
MVSKVEDLKVLAFCAAILFVAHNRQISVSRPTSLRSDWWHPGSRLEFSDFGESQIESKKARTAALNGSV